MIVIILIGKFQVRILQESAWSDQFDDTCIVITWVTDGQRDVLLQMIGSTVRLYYYVIRMYNIIWLPQITHNKQ